MKGREGITCLSSSVTADKSIQGPVIYPTVVPIFSKNMPQGKMKVKARMPPKMQAKTGKKGQAHTTRKGLFQCFISLVSVTDYLT